MAKKRPDPKKSRLKRFGKWSDAHRADVLEEVGLSDKDFAALSRGQRRSTLDRALSLNVQSKDPAYTAAPQSIEQLRAAAGNAGQLRYGQAQSTLGQYGQSIDPWFQDYVTRTQQVQGQQQAMAAPVIQQAQTNAEQSGKTVLNADPNSEAAQNDVLAAASRKAMGDMFANLLAGQQTATNTQYAQNTGAVEAARVGEHRTQKQALADLLKEKGAFETDYLTDARDKEHTKGLERKAFGLDVAKARADVQADRQKVRQDRREDRQRQRDKDEDQKLQRDKFGSDKEKDAYQRKNHLGPYKLPAPKTKKSLTPAEKRARRNEKAEGQQRSDYIESVVRNPPTYPKGHPKAGKTPTRAEIIDQLVRQGYSKAEIKKALRKAYPYQQRQGTAPNRDSQAG